MEKNTTDKGWEAMQQLLDREMPVKPTRRRLVGGWWWLLLLPLAGYSTWEWMKYASILPAQSASPVAQNAHTTPLTANNTPTSATPSITQMAESPTEIAVPAWNNPPSRSAEAIARPSKGAQASTAQTFIAENGSKTPDNLLVNTSQSPDLAWVATPLSLSTDVLNTPIQSIDPHTNIPSNKPQTIQGASIKPLQRRVFKTWTFGSITALTSEQFTSVNGFSTGVNVDWAFSRKWGLRSGLLYQIYTPEENHRPVASIERNDYASNIAQNLIIVDAHTGVEVIQTTPGDYVNSLTENVLVPLNRIQRLEIPLSLFWQANTQVKVLGGLSVSRILSTRADRQNYSGQYLLQLTNQAAQDDASRLIANQLGRWNTVATVGIGWALAQQFELGFSARLPFSKQPSYTPPPSIGGPTTPPGLPDAKRRYTPTYAIHGILFF